MRLLARSAVDETVRRNVEFQGKAGLRPRVVRTAERGACKWCRAQAGHYDYPDVPKDVYRRHENCRCRVEYAPRDGGRQDVWGKQWTRPEKRDVMRIHVRGDIFPSPYTENPESILSERCALAHEYYGHYLQYPSRFPATDWRDEFSASYRAAIDTPNLTDNERAMLMLDAFERARVANIR